MHTRHVRDWRLAVGTPVVPVRVSAQDRRATLQEGDGSRALCFFSSRRRHTRYWRDWSSDVCSSDLALASTSVRSPSDSTCQTGFQYTPAASIATWVQPHSANQSASASRPGVVVPKLRTSVRVPPASARRTAAATPSLCTSSPAQRGWRTSITPALQHRRRRRTPWMQTLDGALPDLAAPGAIGGASGVPDPPDTRARSHHDETDLSADEPRQPATGFLHGGSAIPVSKIGRAHV